MRGPHSAELRRPIGEWRGAERSRPLDGRKRKIESSNGQSTTIKFYRASSRDCEPYCISHQFRVSSGIVRLWPIIFFAQQQTSKRLEIFWHTCPLAKLVDLRLLHYVLSHQAQAAPSSQSVSSLCPHKISSILSLVFSDPGSFKLASSLLQS